MKMESFKEKIILDRNKMLTKHIKEKTFSGDL